LAFGPLAFEQAATTSEARRIDNACGFIDAPD
jgi:hypothetical protein